MLRRRPDDTFEFRQVESTLWRARPASLSPERKEALRLRIMSQLDAQEQVRQAPLLLRERWIAIPAGMGIAAAIVAAVQVEQATAPDTGHRMVVAHATGDLLVDGRASEEARPGQLIEARSYSWLSLGDDVRVGLEPGSSTSYQDDLGRISVRLIHGHLTVANTESAALIVADNWTATLAPGTAAMFRMVDGMVVVTVADGEVTIVVGGRTIHVTAGDGPALITGTPSLAPEAPRDLPPSAAAPAAAQGHQPATNEPQEAAPVNTPAKSGPAGVAAVPATPPPFEDTGFNPPPATKDPDHHDNAGGVAVAPGQAKPAGEAASPTPPSATPPAVHTPAPHAGGASEAPAATPTPAPNPGNAPEWSNAGGNGNGNSTSNSGGDNPNASGGNPNASGGNPNASGGNSNASGGNPNASGGNPNASGGNPNAGPGNSNAGGNGNPKR